MLAHVNEHLPKKIFWTEFVCNFSTKLSTWHSNVKKCSKISEDLYLMFYFSVDIGHWLKRLLITYISMHCCMLLQAPTASFRGVARGEQVPSGAARREAPKSHFSPHFCLLDRYLMQFLQIIYIHYISVNYFGAPPPSHTQF